MKLLNDYRDFFSFLRLPEYGTVKEGLVPKSLFTFKLFILNIILVIPIAVAYGLYDYYTGGGTLANKLDNVTSLYHPVILYTMVAIYEEFSFRGFLTKFNPLLFAISITGIVTMYVKKIAFQNMMFEIEGLIEAGILILVLFPIVFLLAKKYSSFLEKFWEQNFKSVVYISAFLFAFVHFFNAVDLNLSYLKTIVFQLISAFILTFVRIRAGLVFAIIIHFIWNMML